jgi:hypothetical protein
MRPPGWSSQRLRWEKVRPIAGARAHRRCHARSRRRHSDEAQSSTVVDVRLGLFKQLATMCSFALTHKEGKPPRILAKSNDNNTEAAHPRLPERPKPSWGWLHS